MPPQKRQRAAAAAPGGGGGRGRGAGGGRGGRGRGAAARDDNDDDDDDRVADSDEDEQAAARGGGGGGDAEEEEEDEHAAETAADKRLRLAKAYLANLRTELAADKARKRSTLSDEEEEGGDEGEDDEDGGLAARLASDASQARGDRQRELAARVSVPRGAAGVAGAARAPPPAGVLWRGHKLPVTALALSDDDATAWSASKDGALFRWDVETGARTRLPQPPPVPTKGVRGGLTRARGHDAHPAATRETLKLTCRAYAARSRAQRPPRLPAAQGPCAPPRSGAATVLALAVSSDGAMLASAGADKHVHVWDARTGAHLQAFPGHRDAVTCLSFRPGSRTLFSGSADRCVKIWSLDDMAYVDTLYGHANEILALSASRRERALSCGRDRTCRVWKVSEDSQLVFHASALAGSLESAAWVGANEWVTGATDGSLARWAATKKKPAGVWHAAHGEAPAAPPADAESGAARKAGGWGLGGGAGGAAVAAARAAAGAPPPPGLGAAAGWVGAVAAARGSDLVASGAGDGAVRLWRVGAGAFGFDARGALPARGFVNALAVARSGRFVLAGMGQEPRLGRWARDAGARNGVLMHALHVADEGAGEEL
jgi:ribosomal RNA-processing protein 9